MKKLLLFTCILFIGGGSLFAQLPSRLSLHGGFNYDFISIRSQFSDDPFILPYYGLSFGAHYVLVHSNDVFSLGVNPNANFAFSFSNAGGITLEGQVPLYLLARVGAGATQFNEQKFGAGLGAGIAYTYVYFPAFDLNQGFATPNAVAEFSYRAGPSVYSIRVQKSLMRAKALWQNNEFEFSTLGFSIIYTF